MKVLCACSRRLSHFHTVDMTVHATLNGVRQDLKHLAHAFYAALSNCRDFNIPTCTRKSAHSTSAETDQSMWCKHFCKGAQPFHAASAAA